MAGLKKPGSCSIQVRLVLFQFTCEANEILQSLRGTVLILRVQASCECIQNCWQEILHLLSVLWFELENNTLSCVQRSGFNLEDERLQQP